jgi:hypothetical protein
MTLVALFQSLASATSSVAKVLVNLLVCAPSVFVFGDSLILSLTLTFDSKEGFIAQARELTAMMLLRAKLRTA